MATTKPTKPMSVLNMVDDDYAYEIVDSTARANANTAQETAERKIEVIDTPNNGTVTPVDGHVSIRASGNYTSVAGSGNIVTVSTSIPTASTSTAGLVKLLTSVTSSSTTVAATPSSVKQVYDAVQSAISAYSVSLHDNKNAERTCAVHCGSTDCTLGSVTIPQWSFGILICSGGNDASLVAVDGNGVLYTVFRNNGTWGNGQVIDHRTSVVNFKLANFTYNSTLYKSGKVVQFINNAGCTSLTSGQYVNLGTIPKGYRPRWEVRFPMNTFDKDQIVQMIVGEDGSVRAYNYGSAFSGSEHNAYWSTTWIAAD